jgi:hypothetical protein
VDHLLERCDVTLLISLCHIHLHKHRWVPGQTYRDEMEFASCPDDRIHGFKVRLFVCLCGWGGVFLYACACLCVYNIIYIIYMYACMKMRVALSGWSKRIQPPLDHRSIDRPTDHRHIPTIHTHTYTHGFIFR